MDKDSGEAMASIAGRILASGSPIDNTQVRAVLIRSAMDAVQVPGRGDFSFNDVAFLRGVGAVLQPYIENAMSLAGSVLGRDPIAGDGTREDEWLPSEAELEMRQRGAELGLSGEALTILELLKGQAPAGVTWISLHRAAGIRYTFSPTSAALELIEGNWVKMRGEAVFATDPVIANPRISTRPWPKAGEA